MGPPGSMGVGVFYLGGAGCVPGGPGRRSALAHVLAHVGAALVLVAVLAVPAVSYLCSGRDQGSGVSYRLGLDWSDGAVSYLLPL
jgi:hypothetical protein